MAQELKQGTKVHYKPSHGKKENGIIKSIRPDGEGAFVVYNCAGDWGNYRNYTGCSTNFRDIEYGWVDENGKLLKEFCDHHYVPTNSKWKSITQVSCINCGDTID